MARDTRKYDLEVLRKASLSSNPVERRQAWVALERIRHEGSKIKNMREVLIKAHRDGNIQEVKDIHEFIRNRPEYRSWGQDEVWRK